MSVFKDGLIRQGASGATTSVYSIDQSIRFNKSDSAYMSRTVGSGGNTKTWSFSVWFKLGLLGSQRGASPFLWACHQSDSNRLQLSLDSGSLGAAGDFLSIYNGATGSTIFRLSKKLRDIAAWYHLVLVADTSNTIAYDRFRVYLNGQRETLFSTFNAPGLNTDLGWNQSGSTYYLGDYFSTHNGTYSFDGYMAEINHVDGYAYGPEYFGETNSNGIWIPKEYEGSYGTKGFYIDGRDSSDLGDDESGNGNDFTVSGLAAHDQVLDTPTNNFCTINHLYRGTHATVNDYGTTSDGNLELRFIGASNAGTLCTQIMTSGKWYWEVRMEAGGGSSSYFNSSGIAAVNNGYTRSDANLHGTTTGEIGFNSYSGVVKFANSTTKTYSEAPLADGDIIGVAVDIDNGAIYYSKNGTFMGSGNPASGASKTNAGATWTPASYSEGWVPTIAALGGSVPIVTMNFGQEGTFSGTVSAGGNSDANGIGNFKYTVPSGYLALCTKNLGS